MKHAYLILAHTDFALLQVLVSSLDDSRNDIFVHIDKKVSSLPTLNVNHTNVYFVKNRIDVCWGDVSVVEAEYSLFEAASEDGEYSYYHLLSGVDLPIKSQNYIHDFFEKEDGKEFIGYSTYDYKSEVDRKVKRYHLFPKSFRSPSFFVKLSRALFLRMQFTLGLRRNKQIDFKKGTQWVSISEQLLKYVISQKNNVLKNYRNTFCSDEIFLQTLCWNSPFRNNIYYLDEEGKGSLRMIGWKEGQLFDWTEKDWEELKTSDALFARKFNSKDMRFIEKVANLSEDHK